MFDIGWSELVVIVVVALVVIGPKELPGVIRGIGQTIAKLRRMAGDFQGQFNEALKEAELSDLKQSVDELRSIANPLKAFKDEVRNSIETATAEAERALPQLPTDPMPPPSNTLPDLPLDTALPPPVVEPAPPAVEPAPTEQPVAPTTATNTEGGGRAA